MPKFSANLSMLFTELPFFDRFAAAAGSGFDAVEFLFPYEYDKHELKGLLARHRLRLVLFDLPPGDWAAGERGITCLPGRRREFEADVDRAIDYARTLNCTRLNCLAGIAPIGADPAQIRETLVQNLRFACEKAAAAGLDVLLEPINTFDVPGYCVSRSRQALDIIAGVGAENLKLQYDVYHMQIMEGNLARTLRDNVGRIGHIQIADNPGRNEPGTGEINYSFIFKTLDQCGYTAWIGLEYKPKTSTGEGLKWLEAFRP